MKKILFFSLLITGLALSSCKDVRPVDTGADSPFTINFQAHYDGQKLEKYKDYNYDTYTVAFSRFNTYVSDITLLKGTEEIHLSDVEWVDFTPDQASDNFAVDVPLTYQVPEGEYTGIKVGFGVRPDLNAMRPSDFPAGHPLTREIEFWLGWNSYIFTKIEGTGDQNNDGMDDIFMLFHCGSDAVYRSYTFDHPFTVGTDSQMDIQLDLKDLFTINNSWFDLTVPGNQFTSNNPADVTVATILMDNIKNAVHIQ
ncbi:MAG: MbnP family protein [Saprospiraceae bacterium]